MLEHLLAKHRAAVTPMKPKNGAEVGQFSRETTSLSDIFYRLRRLIVYPVLSRSDAFLRQEVSFAVVTAGSKPLGARRVTLQRIWDSGNGVITKSYSSNYCISTAISSFHHAPPNKHHAAHKRKVCPFHSVSVASSLLLPPHRTRRVNPLRLRRPPPGRAPPPQPFPPRSPAPPVWSAACSAPIIVIVVQ